MAFGSSAFRSRKWSAVGGVTGAGIALSLGMLSPAFAEVYGDPLGLVEVGTNGSDVDSWPYLGVSHGGCATGGVAVAIGEANRPCPSGDGMDAYGGKVAIGLLGGDAHSLVAVSDTGNAQADCLGPVPWGTWCAEPGIAVSGTGSSTGTGHTISGTGPSYSTWDDDTGDNSLWPTVAASGLGNAGGGNVSVSGTGSASAAPQPEGPASPGIAVAGGDANANGGLLAVSATGDASGGTYNLDTR